MVDSNVMNLQPSSFHSLSGKWTLWAHLPHDTDWSIDSYKNIDTFEEVEHGIALCETIPERMVKNCMLFLMKQGIKPIWEDPSNRTGGCFSFKISNKNVHETWKKLFYTLIGDTLSEDKEHLNTINGITISPKKNFCIIKIWLSSCKRQNPELLNIKSIKGMSTQGCLFKKHLPEF